MRWAGLVERTEKSGGAYRVLMGRPKEKSLPGESRRVVYGWWIGMIWLKTCTSGGHTAKAVINLGIP